MIWIYVRKIHKHMEIVQMNILRQKNIDEFGKILFVPYKLIEIIGECVFVH